MRLSCSGPPLLLLLLAPAYLFDLAPLEPLGQAGAAGQTDGAAGQAGCPAGTSDADEDAANGCETALPLGGAGLALWLRADRGVELTTDHAVSGWRDLSGRRFHTFYRATTGCPDRPALTTGELGSLPTVSFGATTCLEEVTPRTVTFGQGLSVAIVAVTRSLTPYGLFFEMYSQDGLYIGRDGNSDQLTVGVTRGADKDGQGQTSGATLSTVPVLTPQPTLFVFTVDPQGLSTLRRNGQPVPTRQLVDGVTSTVTLQPRPGDYRLVLGTSASQTASLDGALGEVMVFERALGPSEVTSLEASLQQRWACCSP